MATLHLDLLKQQIDRAKPDFAFFLQGLGSVPTEDDYRAAVRHAHTRLRDRLERLILLYDGLDAHRLARLRERAARRHHVLTEDDVEAARVERLCQEDIAVHFAEEWVRAARKFHLQEEICAAIAARVMVEGEETRVVELRWRVVKEEEEEEKEEE